MVSIRWGVLLLLLLNSKTRVKTPLASFGDNTRQGIQRANKEFGIEGRNLLENEAPLDHNLIILMNILKAMKECLLEILLKNVFHVTLGNLA
jgi:hypothetical protein